MLTTLQQHIEVPVRWRFPNAPAHAAKSLGKLCCMRASRASRQAMLSDAQLQGLASAASQSIDQPIATMVHAVEAQYFGIDQLDK